MNKILMSSPEKTSIINDGKYRFSEDTTLTLEVEDFSKDIFLSVTSHKKVVFNLFSKNSTLNFHIQILKGAEFVFNYFSINGSNTITTNLLEDESKFYLNYSVLNDDNSNNKITVYHDASKTEAYLKNHGFSSGGAKLVFDVSSYITKEASSCISRQDNQILENSQSFSQINPNLYIENYDVEASHSAYIGEFKEDELFYLMSRGLKIEEAKLLLLQAFLMGSLHIDDERREKYQGEIKKYFIREV